MREKGKENLSNDPKGENILIFYQIPSAYALRIYGDHSGEFV